MTGRPEPPSAPSCAACWAAHRFSPLASCWCSGARSPNPRKRKRPCVGASPPPPNARRPKVKRWAHLVNPARHPPQHRIQDVGVWRSVRRRASRPAPLAPHGRRDLPVSGRVHAVAAPALGPLAPPPGPVRAAGRPRREARRPPAPPRCGFARHPAASPVGRSILRHDPRRARHLRRARALTPELRCPQR